mmetsp:Transcript_44362/g.53607  ORF Transcript_44362/g.53607 Transcript_44362/m.53607 type:complete len:199 (+) Transcript_44362:134-730(+)|eukprot:CAMPEP_0172499182 /NCGR_PEP_ID=MMETSP1066-20121228/123504_1 /TAXON_ID=671091 /ORGANISM="Coscinodiscus wailesii, Strain CCMP2513" /LENGTH=198 /DNA_ID=CAMNT_0013272789 /DNA_START=133 /DNA_END=729 /DNA_ORIENTATION=-
MTKHRDLPSLFLLFITINSFVTNATAFAVVGTTSLTATTKSQLKSSIVVVTPHHINNDRVYRRFTTIVRSSKDDEIAALEEKIRQLKRDAAQETSNEDDDDDGKSASTAVTLTPEEMEPFEEMLTEKWKEVPSNDENGGGGNVLVTVAGVLAAVVALALFSQVPVGQENYDKYSSATPSTSIDLGDLNRSKKQGQFDL